MITIEEFTQFKARFQDFEETTRRNSYLSFTTGFAALESGYQKAKSEYDERNRFEAESFNIFSILNVGSLEVRMHTPFLAELLSIAGAHGQRNLFMSSFLTNVVKEFWEDSVKRPISKDEARHSDWQVIQEKEHIDLRLINNTLRKGIFIENKIHTGAHSGQLSRYFRKWKRDFHCNGAFVYLSPVVGEPERSGFAEEICASQVVKSRLLCLSYQVDIAEWLRGCTERISAPRVRETVTQYIHMITSWS